MTTKTILIAAAIYAALCLGGVARGDDDHARLLAAIRQVESGGNDDAIGDHGAARGPYQIHRAYWLDACKFGGVDWSYDLATDEPHARQVVLWYWARYAAGKSDEALARIHNGGPRGDKTHATDGYWNRVKKQLTKVTQ